MNAISAIRSGDYYMFDDFDEELDIISESESSSEDSNIEIDKNRQTVGKVKVYNILTMIYKMR